MFFAVQSTNNAICDAVEAYLGLQEPNVVPGQVNVWAFIRRRTLTNTMFIWMKSHLF